MPAADLHLPFLSRTGVGQVRLRLRQRQGDEGQSEDGGELHLRIPERSAGTRRVVPPTAPPDRGIRHRVEPDQGLEGPSPGRRSEVRCCTALLQRCPQMDPLLLHFA